jgi:hypothetical protein
MTDQKGGPTRRDPAETNANQAPDAGSDVTGRDLTDVRGGQRGIGTEDTAPGAAASTTLGSTTSGQVSGGGERSGAETRSGIAGATSGMAPGHDQPATSIGPVGETGDWGNRSGSGSGGQGESDMDDPSGHETNG